MEKEESPRKRGCVGWLPIIFLSTIEFTVWFVTTFIVLLPLVAPGTAIEGLSPQRQRQPSHLESAIGWLLLIVYQLLFVLLAISVFRAVLTPPGGIPSWLSSDGRSDLHS